MPEYKIALSDSIRKEMAKDPELANVHKYNTPLSIPEMNEFYSWGVNKYGGHDNLLREMGTYDVQGAWKAQKQGQFQTDPNTGHGPDTFKKPNHITFSNQSIYHSDQTPGGQWIQQNGKTMFQPSTMTKKLYGSQALKDYFMRNEPGIDLID